MSIDIATNERHRTFITTCAEFIPYIQGDCMGLSPGADHFQQCLDGLTTIKGIMPEHAVALQAAIVFYETLLRTCPGPRFSMYPRGSQIFKDIGALDAVHEGLLAISDTLGDPA